MHITAHELNKLLQSEDIEGLIEAGAPVDEYESEAEAIAVAIHAQPSDQLSIENIVAIIAATWMQSFNLDRSEINLRAPLINSAAKKIIMLSNKI